ncbi:MAG: tripartite tricarboxylate transporter permease [Marinilabiliales bacterium]|nr:tripartite tricarboxylate transporter permease [Marinilabiliales bacterium]
MFFGQLIGVLPGIGAPTAIALLLPLTFSFNPTSAIIMFAGIYYGVAYGGTITSVLDQRPGRVLLGHDLRGRLCRWPSKGRAGAALSIAAIGSFIAGTVSIVLLMSFAPALARFALRFGPAEYFGLAVMAFGLLTVFGSGSPFKIVISTVVGVLISTIGMDGVSGMPRFTFGITAASGRHRFHRHHLRNLRSGRGLQQHRGAGKRHPGQGEVQAPRGLSDVAGVGRRAAGPSSAAASSAF